MAIFLVELPAKGGQSLVDGTRVMLIEAASAAVAKEIAAAQSSGDVDWEASDVTATDVTTLSPTSYVGWTYKVTVREPNVGGFTGVIEQVEVVATASETTVDSIGSLLATALNATASIANAAYSTPTLTAAGAADNLGNKSLQVDVVPPDGEFAMPSMVGTITDEGLAGAALTVALVIPATRPAVFRKHK